MKKVWVITAISNYSYEASEMKTEVAMDYVSACEKFNKLSKELLNEEKSINSERYNVSKELSFEEYKKIALEHGDIIEYGCTTVCSDDRLISISKELEDESKEEYIVHVYPVNVDKGNFSQIIISHGDCKELDKFFEEIKEL